MKAVPKVTSSYAEEMINSALDNGYAYNRFIEIVKAQGGDWKAVADGKVFTPYKSVNFLAEKEGYVGEIYSSVLGNIVKNICITSHDNNIGLSLKVKVGDYATLLTPPSSPRQVSFGSIGARLPISTSRTPDSSLRLTRAD